MASIDEIVGELGAVKKTLEDSTSQTQAAASSAEEMASAQQSMGVDDKAEAFQALHHEINNLAEAVDGLANSVDDLIAAAQAIGGT